MVLVVSVVVLILQLQERKQGGVEFTKFDILFAIASALAALFLLALIIHF